MTSNQRSATKAHTELGLEACPHCGRTFNLEVIAKHTTICGKMLKKRNVFDSSRQRLEGNVIYTNPPAQDSACGSKMSPAKPLVALPKKRCTFSCELETESTSADKALKKVMATPAAKRTTTTTTEASGKRSASSQANTSNRAPKLERCPHCERSFNRKAFDSHVDWCKKKAVVSSYTSVNSNQDILKAKQRMDARISYKPPTPKTKRATAPQVNHS